MARAAHRCGAKCTSSQASAQPASVAITSWAPATLTFTACSVTPEVTQPNLGKCYKATRQSDLSPYLAAWQGLILQMHVSAIQIELAKCPRQLPLLPG